MDAQPATEKPEGAIGPRDRDILRRLAERVAGLAARPSEKTKRDLWYKHNALEQTRPVIFCDPENGWGEIITADQMECSDALAREWEWRLRREIFWGESMGDDRVIEPYFDIHYSCTETDWGMHETIIGGGHGGAYRWESPLKSYDDLDKLHFPEIKLDMPATQARLALAQEIFGDLLQARLKGAWWWSFGMTHILIRLRGLEQVMLDMYDEPEGLHRVMGFLRDGHLHRVDFLERNNLLSLNNDGAYVGSGGFGYTTELPASDFDGKHVRTRDMWGFAESQETVNVSPQMFEEFVFAYQLPLLQRFGLNCYGCCEPLDRRWHVVEKVPNLRRVSVSPWSNLADMAAKLGDRYIFSMKPNPAYLAVRRIDGDFLRKSLREAIQITRGCRVEIIMKDNHTIGGNPDNVIRWCRIAREEAERAA